MTKCLDKTLIQLIYSTLVGLQISQTIMDGLQQLKIVLRLLVINLSSGMMLDVLCIKSKFNKSICNDCFLKIPIQEGKRSPKYSISQYKYNVKTEYLELFLLLLFLNNL